MSQTKNTKYKVLRVTQLDAEQFEYQLYDLLKTFLIDSFKDGPLTVLLNFQSELSAFLRLVLWNFSVKKNNKTIGQDILGTEFQNKNGSATTAVQRHIFGFHVVILKWLLDRQEFILKGLEIVMKSREHIICVEKLLSWLQTFSQFLTLLNFIQFLKTGDHLNLLERLLQLNHVYSRKPTPRYIDYKNKRREMVWENITETILCLMPFINFRKIINIANKAALKITNVQTKKTDKENIDLTCTVCRELSTNPHCGECGHVYCYYCIQLSLSSAGSFICYNCSFSIVTIKSVECTKHSEK